MRRLTVAMVVAASAMAPTGCRTHPKQAPAAQASQEDAPLLSVIDIDDPKGARQLTRGFYGLENNAWRWTMKQFAVALRPPAGAATDGAKLELKFVLPEQVFKQVGAITMKANVNGADLGAETYSSAGDCTYAHDVPARALTGDAVVAEFTVDKGLPPTAQDARELAVIVTHIALKASAGSK